MEELKEIFEKFVSLKIKSYIALNKKLKDETKIYICDAISLDEY